MNKDKITAMCHKVSSETGLTFNSVMTYYFLENVLRKLSNSKYNDKFIFKGGYILSNIVGLDSRSTVDIDFLIKNMAFDEELLIDMFQDVLDNSKDDSIQYELKDIQEIKKEDKYNGYRVRILCKLDNIRQVVPLDIATGDILTYQPVEYEYKTIFLEDNLKIQAYNLETMLAEKLETIYSKGFLNSRSKDFYDVHLLYRIKSEEINFEKLVVACERTFNYRETILDLVSFKEMISIILSDKGFNDIWNAYSNKNTYVKDTSFENVIESIELLIGKII
ncbi:nucleotidyl transferase AbiEii/AbiGii toxin family protein [Senegalia sp. (in: firmicutes)]|uniref:nucleotidyl transferase AbiEii/AbiGii toxin family protein n=1 Tax=Senegalia sp. (in: firmicutes) TaxID=1924098 RepID=UPI003F94E9B9